VGLLDYYRQFEGMSEEEVNRGLRAQAAERRRKALTRVETLDLSQTTWPESLRSRSLPSAACSATRTCAAPRCTTSSPRATASTPVG
jgi:hypothetical protein